MKKTLKYELKRCEMEDMDKKLAFLAYSGIVTII